MPRTAGRRGAPLGLALAALAVAGGAAPLQGLREAGLPRRARVPGVPLLVQAEDHCGPTSLASLLAWAGRPEAPEALAGLVYLPGRGGTLPIDLSREIPSRGLLAYRVRPGLPACCARSPPEARRWSWRTGGWRGSPCGTTPC